MSAQTDRLDAAVRGVLGPVIGDYKAGRIPWEDVEKRAAKSLGAIRLAVRAARAPAAAAICSDCRSETDPAEAAMIGGQLYCPACAPRHRRLPPPRRAA